MKITTVLFSAAAIFLGAVLVICTTTFLAPQMSYAQTESSQTPSGGSGFGRMHRSGKEPGGLVAVAKDGTPLPTDPDKVSPENVASQIAGDLSVTLALSPYPPAVFKKNEFYINLTDTKGQPITDATVSLALTMPAMWMPANKPKAENTGDGHYYATGIYTMRDWWRIEVIVKRAGKEQSVFFDVWV